MDKYIELSIPSGAKIPTVKAYAGLLLPSEIQDDYCRMNQYGCVASENDDALLVVQTDDIHFSLLPGPEFSPRLYRGQPAFYEACVPSLFRHPMTQIKYVTNLLKKYEFYKLMAGHPMIGYLQNWCIDGKYFKIDMEGLSAHYEFATPMIDVSRSKDVAMFFALCEKNQYNEYEPIIDESREIVLYTIDLKTLLENSNARFHIIGFQALPRPDAQKAYSVMVDYMENFSALPFVSYERFGINRKQSETYFELFEGGTKLFPNDIVDEMALQIKTSKEIDREVLEVCFEKQLIPKAWASASDLGKFLNAFGYVVAEKQLAFSEEERKEIVEKWNNNPPLYGDRVKCRFVSEPRKFGETYT